MNLYDKIISDYKEAFKAKNMDKKNVLNYVISQIKYKEKEFWKIEEDEIYQIIKKEIKSKQESIEFLKKAWKDDDVILEVNAVKILELYLPKMLAEDELITILENEMHELWINDLKSWRWIVFKSIMSKYKSSVDWKLLNDIIQSKL